MYYLGEFSLKTNENDNIDNLNAYLKSLGSRQVIQKRPYKRQFKFELVHFGYSGKFIDSIFDLGDVLHIKPYNSMVKDK